MHAMLYCVRISAFNSHHYNIYPFKTIAQQKQNFLVVFSKQNEFAIQYNSFSDIKWWLFLQQNLCTCMHFIKCDWGWVWVMSSRLYRIDSSLFVKYIKSKRIMSKVILSYKIWETVTLFKYLATIPTTTKMYMYFTMFWQYMVQFVIIVPNAFIYI